MAYEVEQQKLNAQAHNIILSARAKKKKGKKSVGLAILHGWIQSVTNYVPNIPSIETPESR